MSEAMTDAEILALADRLERDQCPENMGCNPIAVNCQCCSMDEAAAALRQLVEERREWVKVGRVE